ncbi:MAG: carboxypeptidase regulatory-like domain-containing protein [Blastocatellia bacterium]
MADRKMKTGEMRLNLFTIPIVLLLLLFVAELRAPALNRTRKHWDTRRYSTGSDSDRAPCGEGASRVPGRYRSRYCTNVARRQVALGQGFHRGRYRSRYCTNVAWFDLAQQRISNSGAATVSGRATIEGKPASGVVVVLKGYDGREWRQFAGATDAEGRFNVVGVPPGAYEIAPHAYAFVMANRSPNARNNERIVVGAGETVDDVSIELVRGGVVTGRVIDEDGRPVVGSHVSLQRAPGDHASHTRFGSESVSGMGETDDRGVYRLFGVPPGRYLVMVGQHLNGGRSGYQVFYPSTTDHLKAKAIEVSVGVENTEINITVVPPEKSYTASGRLIDAGAGKPIPDVYIECRPLDNDHGKTSMVPNSTEFRNTGSDGGFRLVGLRPGQYRLSIRPTRADGIEWYCDDVTVEVADEDVSGIELKAHRGASISGVVTVEGANDPKLLGTFADIYVSAYSPQGAERLSGLSASSKIGPNGGFRLIGLRAGEFQLGASMNGDYKKRLVIQRVEVGGQPVRGYIELREGQSMSDARIVMVYGDGVVRGRVKYQNGEPPKNACFLVTTDRKGECAECQTGFYSQVSAGGQYTLEGLPPGEYELTLQARSCVAGDQPRIASVKQAIRVANGVETRSDFVVDLNRKDQ